MSGELLERDAELGVLATAVAADGAGEEFEGLLALAAAIERQVHQDGGGVSSARV